MWSTPWLTKSSELQQAECILCFKLLPGCYDGWAPGSSIQVLPLSAQHSTSASLPCSQCIITSVIQGGDDSHDTTIELSLKYNGCFSRSLTLVSRFCFFRTPVVVLGGKHVFYPRDAMLARVFATATCLSVCLSVRHTPVLCLSERKQDRETYTI